MSVLLFQRRQAERFAQLIEETGDTRPHLSRSVADAELRQMTSLSQRLSDLPLTVEAHPEFREGLRAMLMATVEREGIGSTATAEPEPEPRRRGFWPERLGPDASPEQRARRRTRTIGAIAAGLAASALVISGMSAASGDAAPGSPLYTVKRSTERAQLALSSSDLKSGQLNLEFARTRLDEARVVRDDPDVLISVLDDMDDETRDGVSLLTTAAVDQTNPAALDIIDSFAAAQKQDLLSLAETLSGTSRDRADASIDLLDRVHARSVKLRPLIPCGESAVGPADELGPVPRAPSCDTTKPNGEGRGSAVQPGGDKSPVPGASGQVAPSGTGNAPQSSITPTPNPSGSDVGGSLMGKVTDVLPSVSD